MTESRLRRHVVNMLRSLDAISVENSAYPGTPDVNFVEGWIELKKIKEWPKRRTSKLKIEHYTPQQRVWLLRRWKKGGCALLLLQVEKEWLLFDGEVAGLKVGRLTREELYNQCLYFWETKPLTDEFLAIISLAMKRKGDSNNGN